MIGSPSEFRCACCGAAFVSVIGCDGEPIFGQCPRCWMNAGNGLGRRRTHESMMQDAAKEAARISDRATVRSMNRDAVRAAANAAQDPTTTWPTRRELGELVVKHLDDEPLRMPRRVAALWVAYFAAVFVLSVSSVRWLLSL